VKVVERRVMSVVVLVVGALLLYFYQHDKLGHYLKDKFHIYVLLGGLVAMVMAVFSFLTAGIEGSCGHDHGDDEDEGCESHEHASDMNPFVGLVIVLAPIFCSLSWTTHGISEARQDALSEINGLYVETEAKLRNEPNRNENGKRMRLFRLMMTCCAADAQAVPMTIEFDDGTPDFAHNSWVRVAGVMSYEREGGVVYPLLKVKRIEEIPVPDGEWSEGLMK